MNTYNRHRSPLETYSKVSGNSKPSDTIGKLLITRDGHPGEEHLLPFQVSRGLSDYAATLVFSGKVLGKRTSAHFW
jgi:hypothetical protein